VPPVSSLRVLLLLGRVVGKQFFLASLLPSRRDPQADRLFKLRLPGDRGKANVWYRTFYSTLLGKGDGLEIVRESVPPST
jgi:hypothetical protein